jgi:hypothetical protein
MSGSGSTFVSKLQDLLSSGYSCYVLRVIGVGLAKLLKCRWEERIALLDLRVAIRRRRTCERVPLGMVIAVPIPV